MSDNNPWGNPETPTTTQATQTTQATTRSTGRRGAAQPPVTAVPEPRVEYDLEGLMTDFPNARELERFVFDETGVVLSLKGRANRIKYQVAMDVLNGLEVDPKFVGTDNPYLERADLVPEEPMKTLGAPDTGIPPRDQLQNEFYSPFVPHSDEEYRARGRRMHVTFRKYRDGTITYEVLGPIEPLPTGEKLDKWGRMRPEIIRWVDPRTPERLIRNSMGQYTGTGQRLRAMMQTFRYNASNQWLRYVDRDFVTLDQRAAENPWSLEDQS